MSSLNSILYLSEKRTCFLGSLHKPLSQISASAILVFSLGGNLEITGNKSLKVYTGRSFLIPPGTNVSLNTNNHITGLIFLDALGEDLDYLTHQMAHTINVSSSQRCYSDYLSEKILIQYAKTVYEDMPDVQVVLEQINKIIGHSPTKLNIDERVKLALDIIRNDSSENTSVEVIAQSLGLSVSRLVQLFKQVTGVPIRRYRLWHRIYMTSIYVAKGMTLTEAAMATGFSDYAHFSRTFKEILGLRPSDILKDKSKIIFKVSVG